MSPLGKRRTEPRRGRSCERRLADAAGADDRQEPPLAEPTGDVVELDLSSVQIHARMPPGRRTPVRQIVTVGLTP